MGYFADPATWVALGKIIWVNILLSGDNAVVIALAARNLPAQQRRIAVLGGSAAAIVMRVVLTIFAVELLGYPYLKIVGALLLFWIGVQLLLPEEENEEGIESHADVWGAIRTILIADLVMSLDNVIAVAAAAQSGPPEARLPLLVIGLGLSIPLIIVGSQLLMKVMERYPIIITLGAALLGFVAGEMLVHDAASERFFGELGQPGVTLIEVAGAVGVVLAGRWLARRRGRLAAAGAAAAIAAAPAAAAAAAEGAAGAAETAPRRHVLVAVDGSENSRQALRRAVALRGNLRDAEKMTLHLVNVQRPLPGDVSRFVAGRTIDEYHRERAEEAMAPVRELLKTLGITAQEHLVTGEPGPAIADAARATGCDLIVMGARGLGGAGAALLGSATLGAIEHAGVPVLVVK
ncbi:MAG: YjbE family putative metal transport protein [Rubrivivax sp.]|nr:YjbE family putative metal transport protein [Rubrivivax sp.]